MANKVSRLATGVSGLDEVLHGGLIAERLYLIDGNPGSGKTTFALQFLLEAMRRGQVCLYVTLSETRQELEEGAASHGWSIADIDIIELIPDVENSLTGDGQLTMIHPADVELSESDLREVKEAASQIEIEGDRYAPQQLAMVGRDAPAASR